MPDVLQDPLMQKLSEAIRYHKRSQFAKAKKLYQQIIKKAPHHVIALLNIGNVCHKLGDSDAALRYINRAIDLQPDNGQGYRQRAIVFEQQQDYIRAITDHQKALSFMPQDGRCLFSIGYCLQQLGDHQQALDHYQRAVVSYPHHKVLYNMALVLCEQGHYEQAIRYFQQVLTAGKPEACVYYNIAKGSGLLQRFEDAISSITRAIALEPDNYKYVAFLISSRDNINDWTDRQSLVDKFHYLITQAIEQGETVLMDPFSLFSLTTDKRLKYRLSTMYADNIAQKISHTKQHVTFSHQQRSHQRLKIAYISGNFRNHATGYSLQQLFRYHDSTQFEVFAYSYSHDDGGAVQQDMINSCEHFVDITALTYVEAAERIYRDEIDILIDLAGHTQDNRFEILMLKPAPIQVSYHVYATSTGADCMDYFIGDSIVTPLSHQDYYREKLALLPHSYRLFNDQEVVETGVFTRQQFQIAEDAFVFCSFNNSYKIEPLIFSVWMEVLHAVPGSVLLLLASKPAQRGQLSQQAQLAGIDPKRVIFTESLSRREHMARHEVADLFLDSYYINAHTTAADALWAGLPILTCMGDAFINRVAASILSAAGLPELITDNLASYKQQAISIGLDRGKAQQLKAKIQRLRNQPFFTVNKTVMDLEKLYHKMWEVFEQGGEATQLIIPADETTS